MEINLEGFLIALYITVIAFVSWRLTRKPKYQATKSTTIGPFNLGTPQVDMADVTSYYSFTYFSKKTSMFHIGNQAYTKANLHIGLEDSLGRDVAKDMAEYILETMEDNLSKFGKDEYRISNHQMLNAKKKAHYHAVVIWRE